MSRTLRRAGRLSLPALSILILTASPVAAKAPDFAEIDAFVQSQMEGARLPGLALVIVQGDRVVHVRGFGVADGAGRPVTPQTPFLIGSTSKSFTALAVMQLVEAGQVELDAPVRRYIPWFRLADEDASARITIRHLLNQTSGISHRTGDQPMSAGDPSDRALEGYVRSLAAAAPGHPVGERFDYSNANYEILGLVVQQVSGQTFEAYVRDHIFQPLGMRNSFASEAEARRHGAAIGHRHWFGRPVANPGLPYPRSFVPSGFLLASAEDMGRYLAAQLNGGRLGEAAILSPQGIAGMHRGAVLLDPSGRMRYGMGWVERTMNDEPVIWHNGDTGHFHADIALIPNGRWGVALLANSSHLLVSPVFDETFSGVVSRLVGRTPKPATAGRRIVRVIYGIVLFIPLLQLVTLVRSVRKLRRWRGRPELRPRGVWGMTIRIALPLILNAALAALLVFGMTSMFGVPYLEILTFMPDLGGALALSVLAALAWLARTALAISAMRDAGAGQAVERRLATA